MKEHRIYKLLLNLGHWEWERTAIKDLKWYCGEDISRVLIKRHILVSLPRYDLLFRLLDSGVLTASQLASCNSETVNLLLVSMRQLERHVSERLFFRIISQNDYKLLSHIGFRFCKSKIPERFLKRLMVLREESPVLRRKIAQTIADQYEKHGNYSPYLFPLMYRFGF